MTGPGSEPRPWAWVLWLWVFLVGCGAVYLARYGNSEGGRLQRLMIETRAILLAGGPDSATEQNRLAKKATAFVKDRDRAAHLAEQLAVAISFHHMLAGMNTEPIGPCQPALDMLAEIEAASS